MAACASCAKDLGSNKGFALQNASSVACADRFCSSCADGLTSATTCPKCSAACDDIANLD